MIPIDTLCYIFLLHWIADYAFQTRWMGNNKSKSNTALLAHIATYTIVLAIFIDPLWALVNGVLHGITDYFTSRSASKYWANKQEYKCFLVMGFDQFVHSATLVITYYWIVIK